MRPWLQRFSFLPNPPFAAKDTLDLYRSGSLIGQTIFSFLLPLAIIWFFLSLLGPFFPPHGLLFIFAITTGVIASTMYTWVTMFDTFGPYACLPVAVSTLISSKLTTFGILQVIPGLFIASVAILTGEAAYLIPAVVLGLSVSFYAVGVMAWLCGLSPAVLVYDVKVLFVYLLLVGIVLTVFTAACLCRPVLRSLCSLPCHPDVAAYSKSKDPLGCGGPGRLLNFKNSDRYLHLAKTALF